MHDFYHQKLFDNPTNFDPRHGNRFLEILESGDNSQVSISEGKIAEADICDFVNNGSSNFPVQGEFKDSSNYARHGLRLLIGSPEEHQSDANILPLSISRLTFEHIRKAWQFPTELLRMMLSTLPMATEFSTYDDSGNVRTMGLMLRGGRSRDWNYCLGLTFNPSTGVTCAMIQGLERGEIEKLRESLRRSQEHSRHPALVPLFLIELKTHFFAILLEMRAARLEETEYETGMKHGYSLDPRRNPALNLERKKSRGNVNIDFDLVTQKLTSLTGTLAFCDLTFESSLRSLEVTMALSQKALRQPTVMSSGAGSKDGGAIELRAAYLKTLIAGAQAHRNVLLQRTRAQVQTVYSLIGQRDNRLNLEIGDASKKIAQATLRDSAAMKAIAEDSKNVAVLTRRASANMRIIAAVTLLFLPGTFIATLFSTSFFDFRASNSQQIVSVWVWLYFVCTLGLTLMVLAAWLYYTRRSLQRQDPKPNKAVKMDEGGADAHVSASLETEISTDSESTRLDGKAAIAGSPG